MKSVSRRPSSVVVFLALIGLGLVIIGFYINKSFELIEKPEPKNPNSLNEKKVDVYPTESADDLIVRCGEIPEKAFFVKRRYDVINGPTWSPDCRYVAWSLWESGTGSDGVPSGTLSENEGVFLFSDKSGLISKIYSPREANQTPIFVKWSDRDNFIFEAGNKKFNYEVSSNETNPLEITEEKLE